MLYSLPLKTLAVCDGRYPTASEEDAITNWAASVPKRMQVANLLAQKESQIVREAIEYMKPRYPRFGALHERAYEKGERDLGLCLRYAVQGMITADPEMPRDKLYVWYGNIIRGLGLTPGYTRESCQALFDACSRHIPTDLFAVAEPYLKRMVDDIATFPEPMKPAIE